MIHAVDKQSSSQRIVYLDDISTEEILTRDLSLSTPFDTTKCFTEIWSSELVLKDNEILIEDVTSTEYIIIDSMKQIWKIIETIG